MKQAKAVIMIIAGVVLSYIGLLISMPTFLSISQGVADNLTARPTIVRYFGVLGLIAYIPWLFWFVPAVAGIIAIVIVFKRQEGQ